MNERKDNNNVSEAIPNTDSHVATTISTPLGYRYVSFVPMDEELPKNTELLIYRYQTPGKKYKEVTLANGCSINKEVVFPEFRWDVVRTIAVGSDGKEISWNTISTCNSVCSLLVVKGRMLFSLTERIILGGTFWEAPAGCIDKGYNPRSAALKELAEEVGFTSDSFMEKSFGGAYLDNGKSDELFGMMVLKATSANWIEPSLEEGEIIGKKIWLSSTEILEGLDRMFKGQKFYEGFDLSGHTYTTLMTLYFHDTHHPNESIFF